MKFCTNKTCQQQNPQPLTEFHKRGNKLKSHCKSCCNSYGKLTFQTQPHRKQSLKKWAKLYKEQSQQYVVDYLNSHPCCKCGETNILTLQFDHLRDKEFEIGLKMTQGYSLERIKNEIEKCQVLCANCHSIKTAYQLGNWKLKWLARSD